MNLDKRISIIEKKISPKKNACIGILNLDGSAHLTCDGEKMLFKDRDEMNAYIETESITDRNILIFKIVNKPSQ